MKLHSFIVVLVVAALLTLPSLAQASPPDPTWIGGLWDDADYDNVVIVVTASVASMTLWPSHDSLRLQAARAFAAPIDESDPRVASRSSGHTRAPPTS